MFKIREAKKLTLQKRQLLIDCFYAIKYADENKIQKFLKEYYSTDDWLEETAEIQFPKIEVRVSGIDHELFLGGKSMVDETLIP